MGNKLAEKYDTPEEKLELIKRFCEHIRKGKSIESFEEADHETIYAYAEKMTAEMSKTGKFTVFPTTLIKKALRASRNQWEEWGIQGMLNKIPYFNAHIWALNMRNRFNWDKDDKSPKELTIDRVITVNFVRKEENTPA